MSNAVAVELVMNGDAAGSPTSALEALVPPFELAVSASQVIRRTWLDTFDWRLHRAGLVLEHNEAGGRHWLTLTSKAGERFTSATVPVHWPGAVDQLPASSLRDRVGGVAGIRALLPVAEARSTVQQIGVLNQDAKTVARVVVDRPAVRGRSARSARSARPAPVPARLSVEAVRGYGPEATLIAHIMGGVPGVEPGAVSVYEQALASAGREPEDYSSKVAISLQPSMPAAVAVATVLQSFLATLEANVAGVIGDVDTEFLHDLRVSVRRTRSVLKLAGDVLPCGVADRFAPEFKWLGDTTTPMRDLDVFVLGFDAMAADLRATDVADLGPFRAHRARQREVERRRLARRLQSKRFERLLADWHSELDAVAEAGPGADGGSTAIELAEQRVAHAYRRVAKHGSAITPDSPGEDLHTLRKRCKELRYLLEIFSSLHEPSAHRRVVKELKELQECLGDFQDGEVQREAVSEAAAQMTDEGTVPAGTLLAMGELVARLDANQRDARQEYAGRFDRFMRRGNRQAVAELTKANGS